MKESISEVRSVSENHTDVQNSFLAVKPTGHGAAVDAHSFSNLTQMFLV